MTRKYFGTDGIRGCANKPPMTAETALKVAMAAACVMRDNPDVKQSHKPRVVIGKDTRLSGYIFEQAMAAGFEAMGMNVFFSGPIPTPAVAMLTRSLRASIGVMISASHNPYEDNGIKLFGSDGYKLPDALEAKIEALMNDDLVPMLAKPDEVGNATRLDDARGRYIEFLKSSLPRGQNLRGIRVVLDCANGAAYKTAPKLLWELGADLVSIHRDPDGKNINDGCGATQPQSLQAAVLKENADVGIALDGDADRLIVVDETGAIVDGDQLLALLGSEMKGLGTLKSDTVVATIMSNLGLERFLKEQGIKLERTAVGDRYVVEKMREGGFNLGGEQSGHLIMSDYGTTGDGLLSALQVLSILKDKGHKASEALRLFQPAPQILKNVRYEKGQTPLDDSHVKKIIQKAEKDLGEEGRLVVRASGTEPLIRVMAEGDDHKAVESAVDEICEAVRMCADKQKTAKAI